MSKMSEFDVITNPEGFYVPLFTPANGGLNRRGLLQKLGLPWVAGQSGVAASVTGTLTETTLASITIPGGSMGANGRVRLHTQWSVTNSANAKTLKAYLNGVAGTAFMSVGLTTSASLERITTIANRNSQASQIGSSTNAANPFTATTAALTTSAIDMSSDRTLVITGTLANTGETITLESYLVEVLYKE